MTTKNLGFGGGNENVSPPSDSLLGQVMSGAAVDGEKAPPPIPLLEIPAAASKGERAIFDAYYDLIADVGPFALADSRGGFEYRRRLADWVESECPTDGIIAGAIDILRAAYPDKEVTVFPDCGLSGAERSQADYDHHVPDGGVLDGQADD